MRVYKFTGKHEDLKDYGYNKFNILSLGSGSQLWGKITEEGSIVISDYVSVKSILEINKPATTQPALVKPFIEDLIHDGLVEIGEKG